MNYTINISTLISLSTTILVIVQCIIVLLLLIRQVYNMFLIGYNTRIQKESEANNKYLKENIDKYYEKNKKGELKDKSFKINKFILAVPAHNEEKVIENIIESLNKIEYDKKLYEICIIADNCTDKTAEKAKKYIKEKANNLRVYERKDELKKTKGYALDYLINTLKKENVEYDAIAIFDADNTVDPKFLKFMNKRLNDGEKLIQGYREIINPYDTWISGSYAIFYWLENKYSNEYKYNKGLSGHINGTGFVVTKDIVEKGWNTLTLTEDIELTTLSILDGKRVVFEPNAIVYDEQPLDLKTSLIQRERWSVGHTDCAELLLKKAIKGFKEKRTIQSLDTVLFLTGELEFKLLLAGIFNLILLYILNRNKLTLILDLLDISVRFWVMIAILCAGLYFAKEIIVGLNIVHRLKKDTKKIWKAVCLRPIFLITWLYIHIKILVKPNKTWEKVEHGNIKDN